MIIVFIEIMLSFTFSALNYCHKCLSNQWKRRIINDTSSNQTSSIFSGKSQNPVRSLLIAYFCLKIYLNVVSVNDFLKIFKCHV